MVILQFFLIFQEIQALEIQIFSSSFTDPVHYLSISQHLSDLKHFVVNSHLTSIEDTSNLDGSSIDLAIDLTSSLLLSQTILGYCESFEIPVLYLDPRTFIKSTWAFCLHSDIEYHALSLVMLVSHLEWYRVALISQNDELSIKISEKFESLSSSALHTYLSLDASSETVDDLVSKKLKSEGFKQVLIIGEGEFVDRLCASMQSHMMYHYSGIISGSLSSWSLYNEKSVFIVEAGLEQASSKISYELLAIEKLLDSIDKKFGKNEINGKSIHDFLESSTLNHMKRPIFTVINKVNSQKTQIGSFTGKGIILTSPLVFPTVVPDNTPPLIYSSLSMNNPSGFPSATYTPYMQTGAMVAYKLISQSQSKLKNHLLSPFSASCGSEFFVEVLSQMCWSQSSQALGNFYLTSPIFSVTEGESSVFQSLNLKVPMIGGMDTTSDLSNSTKYPFFTRIVGSIDTTAYLINIFSAMNWDRFSIIYTNTSIFRAVHQSIVGLNVKIENSESLRVLPAGYNDSMFEEYKDVFLEVDRTKLRTIFLITLIDEAFHIAKGFKRIGLKTGDLIGFFTMLISSNVNVQTDPGLKEAFVDIFQYGLIVSGLEFIGDYGAAVKESIKETIGERVENTCYSFDAMMLGINAIDYLLMAGLPYEDPSVLLKSIRNQRFEGCSGIISIDPNSNDRRNYKFGLFQLVYNNNTQSYEDNLVAVIDQDEIAPVVMVDNFTWDSQFTSVPSNSRLDGLSCPFEDREIRSHSTSKGLLWFFVVFYMIYTLLVSVFIWLKWWNKNAKMMDQPLPEKFGDHVVMIMIFVDFLQVVGMGPGLHPFLFGTETLPEAVSINLSNIINFTKEVYWMALYITLIVVLSWLLVSVIIIGRLGETYDLKIFKAINKLGINLIPLVADALFLPVVSICFFIYDCEKSTGNDLTDAFLTKDCYTYCWEGSHLTYVILASLALIVYLPLSIFLRPLWQELEPDVNIHTNSINYIGKGSIQVAVVVLNRTVKKVHQSLFGLVLILIFLLFSFILVRFKPYNYARANLWKLLSHVAICWVFLLASIYWYTKFAPYLWTALLIFGWVGLGVAGTLYQKKHYPSLLVSEKPLDISALVKFTFSKSIKLADQTLKRMSTINFIVGEKYEIKDAESYSPAKRSSAVFDFDGRFDQDNK